uniref:Cation-transporting P-type ATPase C-terminal domain-containing protein n=1 Tax=Anophryoides haemophila TaxID=46462 RepID=A0A7S3ICA5_9CILI|mmetsp:Transcript_21097/g.2822  ORF Transcript_21097/g.2822 Transcript_21097/m.2822 type:complete len:103 (+) Transcript_21097:1931-2239(+)
MIEMFNAINALSDESSLFEIGILANPLLLIAIAGSTIFHCLICYIPFFEGIFGTVELTFNDWVLVLAFSLPVVFLDEILKIVARKKTARELRIRLEASKKAN